MGKGKVKMLTVREVADRLGAAVVSVRLWASRGRFPGAKKETSPAGDYWMIPENSLDDFSMGKAGRPFKPESELKYPRRRSRKGQ